jgi:hypothetical protein
MPKNEAKQKRGAAARAKSLSAERRSEIAKKAARARWTRKATHAGEIHIGDAVIPCFVLDDGERVIAQGGIIRALGIKRGGPGNTDMSTNRLIRFAAGRTVSSYLPASVQDELRSPLLFRALNGTEGHGYSATVLHELCYAVINARRDGRLQKQQMHVADACEVLMMGFAKVGLVALIDEATGYQYERARLALAQILEEYIAKEAARWAKTFPDDYFIEHARLRGLDYRHDRKAPLAGKDTADMVYARLAPGVLDELRAKNPLRKVKHHQFLTPEHGHPKLIEHIAMVTALMRASTSWRQFRTLLNRALPKHGYTLPLMLEEPSDVE